MMPFVMENDMCIGVNFLTYFREVFSVVFFSTVFSHELRLLYEKVNALVS